MTSPGKEFEEGRKDGLHKVMDAVGATVREIQVTQAKMTEDDIRRASLEELVGPDMALRGLATIGNMISRLYNGEDIETVTGRTGVRYAPLSSDGDHDGKRDDTRKAGVLSAVEDLKILADFIDHDCMKTYKDPPPNTLAALQRKFKRSPDELKDDVRVAFTRKMGEITRNLHQMADELRGFADQQEQLSDLHRREERSSRRIRKKRRKIDLP